jgi:hypothetical protein
MTLTRKDLILALREQGCSIAEARRIIDAIFGSMVEALGRREQVDTPVGSFRRARKVSKNCITDVLNGARRVPKLVRRRSAILYTTHIQRPVPLSNLQLRRIGKQLDQIAIDMGWRSHLSEVGKVSRSRMPYMEWAIANPPVE